VIVRLEGTNVDLGKKMLQTSGLNIISDEGLTDAAQQAVKAVKGQAVTA
jgi:succinyl-CoA synthetase beta subunit